MVVVWRTSFNDFIYKLVNSMAGSFGRPLSVLLQNGRRLLAQGPTIRGYCCSGRLANVSSVTSRKFSSAQPATQKETLVIFNW